MSEDRELSLDEVPGLGPVRRAALAEIGVEDLRGLLALKLTELAAVRGVGLYQARKIQEFLRRRGLPTEQAVSLSGSVVAATAAVDLVAVTQATTVLEQQAAAERELEAEVELLTEALAEIEAAPASGDSPAREETTEEADALAPDEDGDDQTEEQGDSGPIPESTAVIDAEALAAGGGKGELKRQREQIPQTALTLVEAIRQAAVSRDLTRQVTRLLIVSGQFTSESCSLSDGKLRKVSEQLARVDEAMQRALAKRDFSPTDQKELAERIRRRRKELERLLERAD